MKHGIWGPDYETDFCFVFFAKLQEVKNEAIQTKKYIFSQIFLVYMRYYPVIAS